MELYAIRRWLNKRSMYYILNFFLNTSANLKSIVKLHLVLLVL